MCELKLLGNYFKSNLLIVERSRTIKLLIPVIFLGLVLLSSCKGERTPLLPNVTGTAGQVVVVINNPIWETDAGRELGRILGSEHPALPQAEPLFDIVRIGHAAFTNIFKTHRNIVIVNISDQYAEAHMNIRKNVWAKPQILMEINASDNNALHSFLGKQEERIVEEIRTAELNRIMEYNRQYEQGSINAQLTESLDVSLVFPPGYTFYVDTTDFAWISFSPPTRDIIQGIFIYQYDYREPETFTPEFLINKRNDFLSMYVPGPSAGSWMTTEEEASPVFNEFMEDERYFAKLRGLWKVENDFMGGPFVSLTTLDEKKNRVITVEGFVYAPGERKRNLLRQVEGIIYTLEIPETE